MVNTFVREPVRCGGTESTHAGFPVDQIWMNTKTTNTFLKNLIVAFLSGKENNIRKLIYCTSYHMGYFSWS